MLVVSFILGYLQKAVAAVHACDFCEAFFVSILSKEAFAATNVQDFDFVMKLISVELLDNAHANFWWESSLNILLLIVCRKFFKMLLQRFICQLFRSLLFQQAWLGETLVRFELIFLESAHSSLSERITSHFGRLRSHLRSIS